MNLVFLVLYFNTHLQYHLNIQLNYNIVATAFILCCQVACRRLELTPPLLPVSTLDSLQNMFLIRFLQPVCTLDKTKCLPKPHLLWFELTNLSLPEDTQSPTLRDTNKDMVQVLSVCCFCSPCLTSYLPPPGPSNNELLYVTSLFIFVKSVHHLTPSGST